MSDTVAAAALAVAVIAAIIGAVFYAREIRTVLMHKTRDTTLWLDPTIGSDLHRGGQPIDGGGGGGGGDGSA